MGGACCALGFQAGEAGRAAPRAPRLAAGIPPAAPSAVHSKPKVGGNDREAGRELSVSSVQGCLRQRVCSEASTGHGCWRGQHITPHVPRWGDLPECPLGTKLALGATGRQGQNEAHLSSSHLQRVGRGHLNQMCPLVSLTTHRSERVPNWAPPHLRHHPALLTPAREDRKNPNPVQFPTENPTSPEIPAIQRP